MNWPSINAVIIPASASIFLGDSCITNVHTRSTNACYAGAIPSCQPIDIIPLTYADAMEGDWGPPGRFSWKRRSTSIDPYVELMGEAKRMGDDWPPVRVGLFKGSTKRFLETAEKYKKLRVIRN